MQRKVNRRSKKPEGFRAGQSSGQTKARVISKTCVLAT